MGGPTSFEELCLSMQDLIDEGKIRGWGLCNDNAYGLAACTRTAKGLGVTPPCSIQGDFSLIDRKVRCCSLRIESPAFIPTHHHYRAMYIYRAKKMA